MTRSLRLGVVLLSAQLGFSVSCADRELTPAALDTANENCASCRMRVSNVKFAAQVVAPGEEPKFYDDLGCFANALKESAQPSAAVAFVADHRTGEWARADRAVYVRVMALDTPMNSHIIAHASAESRGQDPDAKDGEPLTREQMFGTASVPNGTAK